jgi:hypothetical protein
LRIIFNRFKEKYLLLAEDRNDDFATIYYNNNKNEGQYEYNNDKYECINMCTKLHPYCERALKVSRKTHVRLSWKTANACGQGTGNRYQITHISTSKRNMACCITLRCVLMLRTADKVSLTRSSKRS